MTFFEDDYIKSNERSSRFERRVKDKSFRTRARSVERLTVKEKMNIKRNKSKRKISLQRKANMIKKINDNNLF